MRPFNNTVSPGSLSQRQLASSLFPLQSGEYGLLSRAVERQMPRKKKKGSKRKRSINLELELQDTIRRRMQAQQRHYSMDKLMTLSNSKNEQIRRHIRQKAELEGLNQELKVKMMSPTPRQLELQRKVNDLQVELVRLRSQFEQKQLKLKEQMQQLKTDHFKQLKQMREDYQREQQRDRKVNQLNSTNYISTSHNYNSYKQDRQSQNHSNNSNRGREVVQYRSGSNNSRNASPVKTSQRVQSPALNSQAVVYNKQNNYGRTESPLKTQPRQGRNIQPMANAYNSYSNAYRTSQGNFHSQNHVQQSSKPQEARQMQSQPSYRILPPSPSQGTSQTYRQSLQDTFGRADKPAQSNNTTAQTHPTASTLPSPATQGVDSQINDIYKRYYLHD